MLQHKIKGHEILFNLSKEHITAGKNFNRWLVPPAALAVHLSIGMAYGFSVFWKPLGTTLTNADGTPVAACAAGATTFSEKIAGTGTALFATDCNWTQFDLGWMYTLFFVLLGCSAALWGGWLERAGPRKAGLVSMLCWCGGLLISALGVYHHQLWMMWLGSGVIGGIGLGLGYISPVSTLIKWFPDRRGMATGMAIMGFGGGAMIGSPLATKLMSLFATHTEPGVWQTFVVLAIVYAIFMTCGSLGYRIPAANWKPEGWTPPDQQHKRMVVNRHVHLDKAHKTPQFWLLWLMLCMNVSAAIGIIGAAAPMLQETFGGQLVGQPALGFAEVKLDESLAIAAAAMGAGFVGLVSVFNILGRLGWATSSDKLGRRNTYFVFFVLGAVMYLTANYAANQQHLGLFLIVVCVIASMYGGSFSTIPAYLADLFGTQFVGAIHGRILTAWSTAGIVGPVIVNYMHDMRLEAKVPFADIYGSIFLTLAGLLGIGFIANLLVRPVADKYFMTDAELAAEQALDKPKNATAKSASSLRNAAASPAWLIKFAWLAVLIPIAYGICMTIQKAWALFA